MPPKKQSKRGHSHFRAEKLKSSLQNTSESRPWENSSKQADNSAGQDNTSTAADPLRSPPVSHGEDHEGGSGNPIARVITEGIDWEGRLYWGVVCTAVMRD